MKKALDNLTFSKDDHKYHLLPQHLCTYHLKQSCQSLTVCKEKRSIQTLSQVWNWSIRFHFLVWRCEKGARRQWKLNIGTTVFTLYNSISKRLHLSEVSLKFLQSRRFEHLFLLMNGPQSVGAALLVILETAKGLSLTKFYEVLKFCFARLSLQLM